MQVTGDVLRLGLGLGLLTRLLVLQAEGVNEKIGYPDYILDDEALNKEFDGVRDLELEVVILLILCRC